MPFTPLHMGPGLAVMAVMQRKFSLLVFGWSQVVIDLQPLLAMTTGRVELHGFSHTLLGATLIGLLCGLSGKHLAEWGLRLLREPRHLPMRWRVWGSRCSPFMARRRHRRSPRSNKLSPPCRTTSRAARASR